MGGTRFMLSCCVQRWWHCHIHWYLVPVLLRLVLLEISCCRVPSSPPGNSILSCPRQLRVVCCCFRQFRIAMSSSENTSIPCCRVLLGKPFNSVFKQFDCCVAPIQTLQPFRVRPRIRRYIDYPALALIPCTPLPGCAAEGRLLL